MNWQPIDTAPENVRVLVVQDTSFVMAARYRERHAIWEWVDDFGEWIPSGYLTHWAPLPEPPK